MLKSKESGKVQCRDVLVITLDLPNTDECFIIFEFLYFLHDVPLI